MKSYATMLVGQLFFKLQKISFLTSIPELTSVHYLYLASISYIPFMFDIPVIKKFNKLFFNIEIY